MGEDDDINSLLDDFFKSLPTKEDTNKARKYLKKVIEVNVDYPDAINIDVWNRVEEMFEYYLRYWKPGDNGDVLEDIFSKLMCGESKISKGKHLCPLHTFSKYCNGKYNNCCDGIFQVMENMIVLVDFLAFCKNPNIDSIMTEVRKGIVPVHKYVRIRKIAWMNYIGKSLKGD